MKLRIQPSQLLRLRGASRSTSAIRYSSTSTSSSTSASTSSAPSPSRKTAPRARRVEGQEEWQDQYNALDSQLTSSATSNSGASSSKSQFSKYTKPATEIKDEPVLKSNPYADTYRIEESELDEQDSISVGASEQSDRRRISKGLRELMEGMGKSDTYMPRRRRRERNEHTSTETTGPNEAEDADSASPGEERVLKLGDHEVRIQQGGVTLTVDDKPRFISYVRLRDACPCPRCIDPSTRQKVHTSADAYNEIVDSVFDKSVPGKRRVQPNKDRTALRIEWAADHYGYFHLSRLLRMSDPGRSQSRSSPVGRNFWDKSTLLKASKALHVQYADLARIDANRDAVLLQALVQLQRFGIVVIKGVPTETSGNADSSLREVMGWIGEIRNTFYGETWNVRNMANSKNIAYTNLNLGLHMDLLFSYFQNPPRFQALHCLRNRVEGGSSYFVDSFAAASDYMRDVTSRGEDKHNVQIEFEYDNDGHYLHHCHPLMPFDKRRLDHVKAAVNWSPPFQGLPTPTSVGPLPEHQLKWYQAIDDFQKLLEQPHREWEFTMEEGDLVLFDNRRVLHARRAFRDLTEAESEERGVEVIEGESSRWLKGCYLDGEVVWDKLVTLDRQVNGTAE